MIMPNQAAPYPRDPDADDATAENLARHFVAQAQFHYGRTMSHAAYDDAARLSTAQLVSGFGIVHLLRTLLALDPVKADEAARSLIACWEDGATTAELLYEWADEYGMDADGLAAAGAASVKP